PEHLLHLLGTMPDGDLAVLAGTNAWTVARTRQRENIAPYKPPSDDEGAEAEPGEDPAAQPVDAGDAAANSEAGLVEALSVPSAPAPGPVAGGAEAAAASGAAADEAVA
ncbi:MAG: hypothetical protein ACK56I_19255, partial [bacterium]